MSEAVTFKFKFVNENGYPAGFRAKQGSVDSCGIVLDDTTVKFDTIQDTTVRDKRLVIIGTNGKHVVVEVTDKKARDLERIIDRYSSKVLANLNRERLIEEGKEAEFRITTCPACTSTVDVSSTNVSKYVYCRYCETIFTEKNTLVTNGETYRPCDECGMFDRVRGYTEFYFYFLLVVYGWRSNRRFLCDSCAHNLFMRMFFMNFIFVLGVPVAIYNKIQSMTGRDPYLKRLAKANSLAQKGDYQRAAEIYKALHEKYPEHPALLLNEAKGHLVGGDGNGAMSLLSRSLKSTPTYIPSHQFLFNLKQMSDRSQYMR